MTSIWEKQSSNERPLEVDETSSQKYVYITRNVEEIETEEGSTTYTYEECKINKEIYPFVKNDIMKEV